MTVESRAASSTIRADLDMPQRWRPKVEPEKEWLRIVNPDQPRYEIVASEP